MGNVVVNTEGGNRFELSYYSENGINVVRTSFMIHLLYRSILDIWLTRRKQIY